MATIETLEVQFKVSREQFTRELGVIQGQLSELTDITKGTSQAIGGNLSGSMFKSQLAVQVFTKALSSMLGVIRGIGGLLFNLGKQLMISGSQLSRLKIATDTVARNMGITSEEVDGLRKSLAESNTYGIKAEQVMSSLIRSGLIPMAKELETVDARTGETAKGVNALVLTMKDLAAVAGMDSAEGIGAISDFIVSGRTGMVEGMIELGNLGTEYREYAKSINKGRTDLTALEEAQARLNIVMREGQKALGTYANTYATSGKMLSSIRDATASLFEELGGALEPLWASISTGVLNFVQSIRNFLTDNSNQFRAWAIKVGAWVMFVWQMLGRLLTNLPVIGSYFQKLSTVALKGAKVYEGNAKSTDKMAGAMDNASGSAKDLKKELQGLQGFDEMNVLKEPDSSSGGGGGIGGVGGGIDTTGETGGLMEGVGEAIDTQIEAIKEKFRNFIQNIRDRFQPLIDILRTWISDWIIPAWDEFKKRVQSLFNTFRNSPVGDILKIIAGIMGGILLVAVTAIYYAIVGLVILWDEFFKLVNKGIINLVAWLTGVIYKVQELSIRFKWFFEDVKKWIANYIEGYKERWRQLFSSIGGFITSARGWFVGLWYSIRDIFTSIYSWGRDRFLGFIGVVSYVVSSIKSKFDGLKSGLANLTSGFGATIKAGVNGIIDLVNNFIRTLNRVKLPEWTGLGNVGFSIPTIPRLATGGIVSEPTTALIGERGREAVLPLDRNTEWMDELASKINGSGQPLHLTVQVGDEKIAETIIDYIQGKSFRSQANIINI